jgi:hypothetical protein
MNDECGCDDEKKKTEKSEKKSFFSQKRWLDLGRRRERLVCLVCLQCWR